MWELADNLSAFSFFDDRIDVAIQTSCGITEDEFSLNGYRRVLRSLPAGAGGLGIPRFAGLAGEPGFISSILPSLNRGSGSGVSG